MGDFVCLFVSLLLYHVTNTHKEVCKLFKNNNHDHNLVHVSVLLGSKIINLNNAAPTMKLKVCIRAFLSSIEKRIPLLTSALNFVESSAPKLTIQVNLADIELLQNSPNLILSHGRYFGKSRYMRNRHDTEKLYRGTIFFGIGLLKQN